MSAPWVARLPAMRASLAAPLRVRPHIVAAEVSPWLWLRGAELTDELEQALRCIPDLELFHLGDGDALLPSGRRVPIGRVPSGDWKLLRAWLPVETPPTRMAAASVAPVAIRLVRTTQEVPPSAFLTTIDALTSWAAFAPLMRLRRLSFACAADGRCVVIGTPLPPIPGTPCVDFGGVIRPAGWRCDPDVDPAVVAQTFRVDGESRVILDPAGGAERIEASAIIPLTRRAARATQRALRSAGRE